MNASREEREQDPKTVICDAGQCEQAVGSEPPLLYRTYIELQLAGEQEMLSYTVASFCLTSG